MTNGTGFPIYEGSADGLLPSVNTLELYTTVPPLSKVSSDLIPAAREGHGCDKPVQVMGRVVTGRGQGSKSQPDANPNPTHGFPGSKTGRCSRPFPSMSRQSCPSLALMRVLTSARLKLLEMPGGTRVARGTSSSHVLVSTILI